MIPEIPLQDYIDNIWPSLPHSLEDNVDAITRILEENGIIDVFNDRWAAFPVDPVKAHEQEGVVYQGLTNIFDAVAAAAKKIDSSLQQTFSLIVKGNVPMYSDRGASSRPDAFNKLLTKNKEAQDQAKQKEEEEAPAKENTAEKTQNKKPNNERHFVYDLANPQQFKLSDSQNDANDDFAKLIYDMEQILALDPCRRFTFGTTIENRSTRLWFLSRATLLRTKPFDFIAERHQLVRIFVSLAFSSTTHMGWDPTITCSRADQAERRQYTIEISSQFYTTVDVLSNSVADSPLGRATRVWKVRDSGGEIRVLKDVWLETDRLEEHKIRDAILADARALKEGEGDNYDEQLEKRMLNPMAYWRVRVGGEEDDTGTVMLGGYDLDNAPKVNLIAPKTPSSVDTQSVAMSTPADRDSTPLSSTTVEPHQSSASVQPTEHSHPQRTILERASERETQRHSTHHRYHYRIVFAQCATTIYDERSLENVFRALVEVVKALYVLHLAGWVHRDISGGNVYWYKDGNIGLIGDFEYAIRMSDRGRHDVRTGTPFFMAAETLVNGYLFTSAKRKLMAKSQTRIDFNFTKKKSTNKPRVVVPPVPFAYNPLHDLESVWWIINYVIFFNDDESNSSNDPSRRQRKMHELFHGRLDVNGREVFLRDFHRLPHAEKYLSLSFAPALEIIMDLAEILTTAYTNSEKIYPDKIDDQFFIIHNDFLDQLISEGHLDRFSAITLAPVKENAKKWTNAMPPEAERLMKHSR
ncbi:hypothetical protein J3R30DRAFT_3338776 [Lentinula aciculospora]|uniref:Fungal-type protein kinase domain-containing protein n=1 Tax=Lentinula aciculospora TaxID=153920 RepID=A0A9W9A2J0_9AGAR|nr:hypothetical protein J3R30DRAFT_3338776 [Lentinula aciculospora]